MADFRPGDFEGTFEFFILSGFSDGPRSLPEIQQRLRWAERLLYVAARNKGQQGHRSLLELLDRLQKEGLLRVERGCAEQGAGEVYSLTDSGAHRLSEERARRSSLVSQFVEEADLDQSFRRFLDGNLPTVS
jgi:DNA-binding PadR family transcriptional regulator